MIVPHEKLEAFRLVPPSRMALPSWLVLRSYVSWALLIAVALCYPRSGYAESMQGPRRSDHPVGEHGVRYGPWNRDLELWASRDGRTFMYKGVFVERGGVPTLAKTPRGRLVVAFQWFPLDRPEAFDQIAVMFSEDHGDQWTDPQPIELVGLPAHLHRAFDPTLVVLKNGTFRLYFTSERGGRRGNRAIFSATSRDGIRYTVEPGQRFGLEGEETFDAAVAKLGATWHLYCPIFGSSGRGYHAISQDGLNFTRKPDVTVGDQGDWLGTVLSVEGGLRFYGSGRRGGWVAFSSDGSHWTIADDARSRGADPGVVITDEGRILHVTIGPLREDATTERPFVRREGR